MASLALIVLAIGLVVVAALPGKETETTVEQLNSVGVTAFSAYRDTALGPVSVDTVVDYLVETNVGGAFDGMFFTAPVTGLYSFTLSSRGKGTMIKLMFESQFKPTVYVSDSTGPSGSTSNTIHLIVNKDQRVWVELIFYESSLLQSSLNRYTTFSGMLIHGFI